MSADQLHSADADGNKPDRTLENLLSSLEGAIVDHPGFMRCGLGFEVIHADWPAYPWGHGLGPAIVSLLEYPAQTLFFPIDHIDQCTLFVVGEVPKKDVYDERLLHIAVWDEDLAELSQMRLLDGLSVVRYTGKEATMDIFLEYPTRSVMLTDLGHEVGLFLELTRQSQWKLINDLLPMIIARKYDSAVRDAAVGLESRMKTICGTTSIGQKLVEECVGENGKLTHSKLSNAHRLELRAMFRRFFKFVRNEVAHNEIAFDLLSAARMVNKCSLLHDILDNLG